MKIDIVGRDRTSQKIARRSGYIFSLQPGAVNTNVLHASHRTCSDYGTEPVRTQQSLGHFPFRDELFDSLPDSNRYADFERRGIVQSWAQTFHEVCNSSLPKRGECTRNAPVATCIRHRAIITESR